MACCTNGVNLFLFNIELRYCAVDPWLCISVLLCSWLYRYL